MSATFPTSHIVKRRDGSRASILDLQGMSGAGCWLSKTLWAKAGYFRGFIATFPSRHPQLGIQFILLQGVVSTT